MKKLTIVTIMLLISCVIAQKSILSQDKQETPKTGIKGKLIFKDTGKGIKDISVIINGYVRATNESIRKTFTTGEDGKYADYHLPIEIENISTEAGKTVEMNLETKMGAAITGRIINSEGTPLEKAMFKFSTAGLYCSMGIYTDKEGKFLAKGIDPDNECVIYVFQQKAVYLSITTIPKGKLKPGEEYDMKEYKLPKLTGTKNISGVVTSDIGLPGSDFRLVFVVKGLNDNKHIEGTLAETRGKFSEEYPPGKYVIRNFSKEKGTSSSKYKDFEMEIEILPNKPLELEIKLKGRVTDIKD